MGLNSFSFKFFHFNRKEASRNTISGLPWKFLDHFLACGWCRGSGRSKWRCWNWGRPLVLAWGVMGRVAVPIAWRSLKLQKMVQWILSRQCIWKYPLLFGWHAPFKKVKHGFLGGLLLRCSKRCCRRWFQTLSVGGVVLLNHRAPNHQPWV